MVSLMGPKVKMLLVDLEASGSRLGKNQSTIDEIVYFCINRVFNIIIHIAERIKN